MIDRDAVVLVTGASSGIGREVAIAFARRGLRTVLVARRVERLDETLRAVRAEGSEGALLVGDVGDSTTAAAAIDLARRRFGRLDVLVNNAAIPMRKHLVDVTVADADATVRTNLLGPIYFVLAAWPLLAERRAGTIVNVSSVAGRLGNPREAIYSASKFGLVGLSEAMHHDLHRRGIHTMLVIPGPIDTEIWDKLAMPPAYRGRRVPAEVVARAIVEGVDKRRHVVTVPRRFGLVAALKALLPGLVRRGVDAFDPDRGDA